MPESAPSCLRCATPLVRVGLVGGAWACPACYSVRTLSGGVAEVVSPGEVRLATFECRLFDVECRVAELEHGLSVVADRTRGGG